MVIQTAFLGDVVLTTPLISALAERHGPVDVVTTPAAASLLETHPAVRSVLRYDKQGRDGGVSGLWKLSRKLRAHRYSVVYLPHRSFRSAVLALLSQAGDRIGFGGTAASLSYTRRIRRPEGCHEVERLLALSPGPSHSAPVSLGLTSDDHRDAERWLERHAIAPGFVALAPGSIWGTKRWPYYAELVKRLARPCVVIGSAADCDLADSIVTACPTRAVSAAGALGLRAAAALISRAAVLVTNDSAPLHLATAVGTPVVAVFGPTIPAFGFGPRRPGDLTLGVDQLPCRPCSKHGPEKCPLGHHRCMRDLSVETVAEAVTAVLSREESRAICPRN
ncbi:MAG TPA: lipopolysaccharide heptosyltransferase II [Gemmatimonadales bacterium]|nr:lipopolysaccharide heptosyltransferase II [Gemmatimonadales bacterium]